MVSTWPPWKAMRAASLPASRTPSRLRPSAASIPSALITAASHETVPKGRRPTLRGVACGGAGCAPAARSASGHSPAAAINPRRESMGAPPCCPALYPAVSPAAAQR